jgi:AcrR family transcriptional regulator
VRRGTRNRTAADPPTPGSKEDRILDAVLTVLGRGGISAVSMRAVSAEADVALGLMNYYFDDKTTLIGAALRRLGEQDATIVEDVPGADAESRLRAALRRVGEPQYLSDDYLGLRLQLWSLAGAEPEFAKINHDAQSRYRDGLAALIADARPDLDDHEIQRRAADVLIVQNGIWLTTILIREPEAIERAIDKTERIALGIEPTSSMTS